MNDLKPFIAVGIETRRREEAVEDIDTIYFFEPQPGVFYHSSESIPRKKLVIEEPTGKTRCFTPHTFTRIDQELHIIARNGIWNGGITGLVLKKDFRELFEGMKKGMMGSGSVEELVNHASLRGSLEKIDFGAMYLAVYGAGEKRHESDHKMEDESGSKTEERGALLPGVLLCSQRGNFDDFQLVKGVHPTGRLIPQRANGTIDGVIIPCEQKLQRQPAGYLKNPLMAGQVMTAAHDHGFTICTDDQESLVLLADEQELVRYHKPDDFHYFSPKNFPEGSGRERNYLPSEASAAALVQHQGNTYALLGVDDGKLLIYYIAAERPGEGRLHYFKTISFLSLEDCILKNPLRDYHVRNVKEDFPGMIGLTIHNLWLGLTMEQLLQAQPKSLRILYQEQQDEPSNLRDLTSTDSLRQACVLPHRITDWTYHIERAGRKS